MPQQLDLEPIDNQKLDLQPLDLQPVDDNESLLSKAWKALNTGLISPGTVEALQTVLFPEAVKEHPKIAEFGANVASGLTSPATIGLGLLTGGEALAGKAGLAGIESALGTVGKAASVPYTIESLYNTVRPDASLSDRATGLLGTGLGLFGLRDIGMPEEIAMPNKANLPDWLNSQANKTPVESNLPINRIKMPLMLEGHKEPLLLPEKTSPIREAQPRLNRPENEPRFYAGEGGVVDNSFNYPIDLADYRKLNDNELVEHIDPKTGKPTIERSTLLPSEQGEIGYLNPMDLAAGRTANLFPGLTKFGDYIKSPTLKKQLQESLGFIPRDEYPSYVLPTPMAKEGEEAVDPIIQHYKNGGEIIEPPKPERPYDPNNFDVVNRSHSPEFLGKIADSNPAMKNGDVIKPNPDLINSIPVDPVTPTDNTVPRAGQARPASKWAELNDTNKVMLDHPETNQIGEIGTRAVDEEQKFIATTLREYQQYAAGLNQSQRETLGRILNGEAVAATPDLMNRANGLRNMLESIYQMIPDKTGIGKIENYFPQLPKDTTNPIVKYYLGSNAENLTKMTDQFSDPEGVGISRFLKTRPEAEGPLEKDINKVLPAYVSSLARELYIRPAVDKMRSLYDSIPNGSTTKDFANAFINNISGYESEGELRKEWNQYASRIGNMIGRSFSELNVPLHILHASTVPASIWPELGTKYSSIGLYKLATQPLSSFNELARTGLVQGESVPWAFKTTADRYKSLVQGLNMVERVAKGIGYFGAKQKFLDQHLSPYEAEMRAIALTKDMTYVSDAARKAKVLTPESNLIGGGAGRLTGQFKGIPLKIINQYKEIAANAKNDPMKFARLVSGAGLTAAFIGNHATHLMNGSALGVLGDTVHNVYQDLAKGDVEGAIKHTIPWLIPGAVGAESTIKLLDQ